MTPPLRALAARLAAIEIWSVAVLVAASLADERLLPVALGVAILFWPIRWLAAGRPGIPTPADWPIGLLVLLVPVSLWATALPQVTQPQVLRLLVGIAFYYAVANWASGAARLRLVTDGLMLAGLVLALAAPFMGGLSGSGKLGFIPTLPGRLPRLLSDAVNPNVMAGNLAVLAPLALAGPLFAWHRLRRIERLLAVLASGAMLAIIVLSQSRGALMGFAVGVLVLVAFRWRRGWLAVPGTALVTGLAAWRIGLGRVVEALAQTQALSGLDVRAEIWSRALYIIQDFPFTGIGMGTFRHVALLLYPFLLAGPDADIPHAHNLFLQVGVDLGVPGLIAWLAVLILVVIAAVRVWRRGRTSGDPWLAGLGVGLLAAQAVLVTHGLIDAVTWGTRPAVLVWAIWGLAMAAARSKPADLAGSSEADGPS